MSMRLHYECLITRCFDNCDRGKDPKGLGSSDTYDTHIIEVGYEIKEGVSYALEEAERKAKEPKAKKEIKNLRKDVWQAATQEEFNSIIRKAHSVLDDEHVGFNPTMD